MTIPDSPFVERVANECPILFYSPRERRRLARADGSPGRRKSIRIDRHRTTFRGATKDALIELTQLTVSGLPRKNFDIELHEGRIVVEFRNADKLHHGQIWKLQRLMSEMVPAALMTFRILYSSFYTVVPKYDPRRVLYWTDDPAMVSDMCSSKIAVG